MEKELKTKTLILVCGVPGSGKSTIAAMYHDFMNFVHLENDMWYYINYGHYCWSHDNAILAYQWCQRRTEEYMKQGKNIVVANTFIKKSEREPYIRFADKYGYRVIMIKAMGNFKDIHDVPRDKIEKMRSEFEEN